MCVARPAQIPKITSLLFLCNILRKKWVMKLIFCMQVSMKAFYKLILWFRWGWSSIPKVPKIASLQCHYNISEKKLKMKFIFLQADKQQRFLQVDFNTLGIKVFYNVMLSLLIGMIKHSQTTQSNKFGISLQYLKKEVGMELIFCMQTNIKVSTSWHNCFWWKWPDISKVPKIGNW